MRVACTYLKLVHHNTVIAIQIIIRVPTGQGKLEKVREFARSGKVRENLTI